MAVVSTKFGNRDAALILQQGAILIGLGMVGAAVSITAQYFAARAMVLLA